MAGMSKAEKKALKEAEEKRLKDALSAPVISDLLDVVPDDVDNQEIEKEGISSEENNLLADFLNSSDNNFDQDEKDLLLAGQEVQDITIDLALGKINIDDAEKKSFDVIEKIKSIDNAEEKLKNIPKKYWKFQTV